MIPEQKTESEICEGHLGIYKNDKCKACKADEDNILCEDYKPAHVSYFEVNENQDRC